MNLFAALKQLLPRGGTITTPTVQSDIAVGDAVVHVPAMLSVSVEWQGDTLVVVPVGVEATGAMALGPFPMRARVKVTRLDLLPDGDVFAVGRWGVVSRRIQLVDAGDA